MSQRPSVEVLNRNLLQFDSFQAADVDCGHPVTLWIGAFSVRVNATRLAKSVFDNMLVERVCADVIFRCAHVELVARHKPQERSFAGTHRTITCHRPIEFAFYFESNLPAVTATRVLHVSA